MDFALSADQLALQSAVRDLIAAHADLTVVRSVVDDPAGDGDPPGLWDRMAAQGWPAILVPEEYDGLGLGLLDAAVVARCLGAGVVPGGFVPSVIGGEAVRLGGEEEQRKAWLPRLAAGEVRFAVALPSPTSSLPGITVSGGTLDGELRLVDYVHVAERLVVAAGDGLWLVDPAADGVTVTRTQVLDGTARPSTVTLRGVAAERLPGGSPEVVAGLSLGATALVSNDLAGIARTALDRTVEYLKTRQQFGRVVGSFQALKHGLADLDVDVTMAEHAAWYAAHALDVGAPDAAFAVSVAKAKTGDAGRLATEKMIQYHGGIGYTWEHEAHLFYKRAKRLAAQAGSADAHRARIAELTIG